MLFDLTRTAPRHSTAATAKALLRPVDLLEAAHADRRSPAEADDRVEIERALTSVIDAIPHPVGQ